MVYRTTIAPFILFLIGILFILLLLVGKIVLCVIVARDAKKNNIGSPALWGIICFFLPIILGIPIYFLVRYASKENTKEYCTFCGRPIDPYYTVCPYCGRTLKTFCPKCNAPVKREWNNCVNCGAELKNNE